MTAQDQAIMTKPSEGDMQPAPGSKGAVLQAKGVTIRTHDGAVLLSDVSFHVEPGELITLTGLTYAAKSLLLQSLAGFVRPTSGEILVDGADLYANLKALRPSIGYVPADCAVQQNLTVSESLEDAATLRLPRRMSKDARWQRVQSILKMTGLKQSTDRRVGTLGRLDMRRLGIALELTGDPRVLLVDEPAEQLSPFDEMQIAILLQELSRMGLTIIRSDSRARGAGVSEKVIFLGPGGSLAWFGPAEEGFHHLRGFVPKGVAKDLPALREALEILANPQAAEGAEWAKRFREHEAYSRYVDDPLQNKDPDLLLQTSPLMRLRMRDSSKEQVPPSAAPGASAAQKFTLLVGRSLRLAGRDKAALWMLVLPLLLALADLALSAAVASDPGRLPIAFSLAIFLSLLTSGLLVQNETFNERAVYRREARTSSLAVPYMLSKAFVVGTLAAYQGLVWSVMHFIGTRAAGGIPALAAHGVTFFLIALIGGLLGLAASSLAAKPARITSWLLLFTFPQLFLDGSLIRLSDLAAPLRLLSGINPSRYAVQALLAAGGNTAATAGSAPANWLMLTVLSLCLLVALLVIQSRAAAARGDPKPGPGAYAS